MINLSCKRYKGEIYRIDSWHLIDQLSDEDNKVINTRSITSYLSDVYGITPQQYYNICIYGDPESIPRCPICGNPRSYKGKLTGYTSTCNSDKCNSIYKHNNFSEYWNKFWNGSDKASIETYRKELSDRTHLRMIKYLDHGSSRLNSPVAAAKRHRNTFIHQHTIYDNCLFYIVKLDQSIKYGISTEENFKGRLKFYNSDRYKVLFKGSKYLMAYLEFLISSKLTTEYCPNSKLGTLAHLIYESASKLELI